MNLHWNRRVTMVQWAALVCEAFDTLYREELLEDEAVRTAYLG